ncbi:MAG: DEAD/DEAH box helicase [Actinomycetaceae bacterium]|nr:DEAD/DEAH box helicase [Actinomycetaceae bacterium]
MSSNHSNPENVGTPALISTLTHLKDEDIIQLVGPTTHAQGQQAYARGDVLKAQFNATQTEAIATVSGATTSYTSWISQPGGAPRELDVRCSCRTGTYCKHIVAALYKFRSMLSATSDSWRDLLLPLLGAPDGGTQLALAVDISGSRLLITPMRQWSGGWTPRRASWADLTSTKWASVSDDIRADHLSLVRQIWQTARKAGHLASPNRIELSMLGEDAYPLLVRARRIGLQLFTSTDATTRLEVSDSLAELTGEKREDGADLVFSIAVRIGGQQTKRFKLVDSTNLVIANGQVLAQLAPGQDELKALAKARKWIRIPAADRADFAVNFAPRLSAIDTDLGAPSLKGRVELRGEYAYITWSALFQSGDAAIEMSVADARARNLSSSAELDRLFEAVYERLEPLIERKEAGVRASVYMPDIPQFVVAARELEAKHPGLTWEFSEDVLGLSINDGPASISVAAIDSEDPDWFNLKVKIDVGGVQLAVGDVMQAVAKGERWVRGEGGTWSQIPIELFEKFELVLSEVTAAELSDEIKIPGRRVGFVQNLEDMHVQVSGDSRWLTGLRNILTLHEAPNLPEPQDANLREYQRAGISWMHQLTSSGFGALLADDMGLGKTLQILALIETKKRAGKLQRGVLVVAPTSVVSTWVGEARRFYPDLKISGVEGTSKTRANSVAQILDENDIVVTSWALLRLDSQEYAGVELDGAVFDEAQAIKNVSTNQSKAARQLRADWKIAATGTPVENTVADLWSIMEAINPGVFPEYQAFTYQFKRPIESGADPEALKRLQQIAAPFLLRRTKQMVAPDLPRKIEQLLPVQLDAHHREYYDAYLNRIRKQMLELLESPKQNATNILAALTRLRMLALDPNLIEQGSSNQIPAKTKLLIEHLETLTARGHKVLVFSQFTSYLRRLRSAIQSSGIAASYMDGTTPDRQAVISEFKSGRTSVFLISLKAGGTGLTLTEADYVYVMDPWWNPAVENQAIDRAHRIGQDKTVNVYRLCAADTIEEKVIALQEHKRQIIDDVVSVPALSAQDLADLLN